VARIDMSENQFCWPVRVYYEDTDAGGVVYHSNYLNFMERTRTEWLRTLGIIVVHSLSINFKKPAKFNDMLLVNCELLKLGRSSIEMTQKITCNGIELIHAHIKVAFVDAVTFKPVAIPALMKQDLIKIQAMNLNMEKV
jgi:acyl-CoA thioester hydrolase